MMSRDAKMDLERVIASSCRHYLSSLGHDSIVRKGSALGVGAWGRIGLC